MAQRESDTARGRRRRKRAMPNAVGRWLPGAFLSAMWGVGDPQVGLLCDGLAVVKAGNASPKGRHPPVYSVIHCGSGHRVVFIEAHEVDAFQIADDLVLLTDWSFDGLSGWKNTDPDLPAKISLFMARHGKKVRMQGGPGDEAAASAIAYARAA